MFIFPQMFIFEGAIQKIEAFFSLTIANPIPIDIQVGKAFYYFNFFLYILIKLFKKRINYQEVL